MATITSQDKVSKIKALLTSYRDSSWLGTEASREECKTACLLDTYNGDKILDTFSLREDNSIPPTEEDITSCIIGLFENNYASCGMQRPELDVKPQGTTTAAKTEILMDLIKRFGYTPYILKRIRLNDPESGCITEGWKQGSDSADCWVDAFLFSLFANDNIANILIRDINEKYQSTLNATTPSEKYMNNALFCITLYLNFMRERKRLYDAKTIHNIKGKVKWCLVYYVIEYLKINIKPTSSNINLIGRIFLDETNFSIPEGGDALVLAYFVGCVTNNFISPPEYMRFKNLSELTTSLASMDTKKARYFAVPVFLGSSKGNAAPTAEKYFPRLTNPKFAGLAFATLEGVCTGTTRHFTSYTLCNGKWRYYNNETKLETITNMDLNKRLNVHFASPYSGNAILIYRLNTTRGGTRKIRRRQNHSLKNIAGGKRKNLTRKIGGKGGFEEYRKAFHKKYFLNLIAVRGDVLKIGPDKAVATLQGTSDRATGFGCDLTTEMAADMLKFDKEDWEFWNNKTKPSVFGKIAKHISVWINPNPPLKCDSIIFYDERYLQIICSVFNKTKEEILTTLTIFDELKSSPKMDLVSIAFGSKWVELTEDGKEKYKMYKEAAAALSD